MKEIIKNIFISLSILSMLSIVVVSCEEDDGTGYSTLVPTSPTISITPGFTSPVTLIEDDSSYSYTVTLSEIQVVDVKLDVAQIDGTADASDYTITSSIVIAAGKTSGTGSIQILSDELIEETETLTIQIGDATTANASLTPITVEFEIQNLTSSDLVADLSWDSDVLDAIGDLGLSATDVVDMSLVLLDEDGEMLDEQDGSSFEQMILSGDDLPDGQYYLSTYIYATIDAGEFDAPVTLDLQLEFNQIGTINGFTLDYPAIMSNQLCSAYQITLASIVKSGSVYTIEEAIASSWYTDLESLVGNWTGLDSYEYDSKTVTSINDGVLQIYGLSYDWTSDWWGEEILDMVPVDIEINWNSQGEFTIPEQYYMTTLYEGDEYQYNIVGSGTINVCGDTPQIIVNYTFLQDGWDVGAYLESYDYPGFSEDITLDPSTKSASILKSAKISNKGLVKPIR